MASSIVVDLFDVDALIKTRVRDFISSVYLQTINFKPAIEITVDKIVFGTTFSKISVADTLVDLGVPRDYANDIELEIHDVVASRLNRLDAIVEQGNGFSNYTMNGLVVTLYSNDYADERPIVYAREVL